MSIRGLSSAASLKEGSTVSWNGIVEFVDPLVWVNPLLCIIFLKLNEEV